MNDHETLSETTQEDGNKFAANLQANGLNKEDSRLHRKKERTSKRLLKRIYIDKHWIYFKKALDFFYPAKDNRKYHIALRSFSSYFLERPKTTIVLGEYNEHLVKKIIHMHPREGVLIYKGVCNQDLVKESWENVKIAYFMFFEENKEIIYNRFMRNIKQFSVRIKSEVFLIHNVSILTSAQKDHLPARFRDSPNLIELSNFRENINRLAIFESFKQGKKYEYGQCKQFILERVKLIKLHIASLRVDFKVEVPYDNLLRTIFNFEHELIPYKELLDLIKYITFFNQKKRACYKDKKTSKIYLLSHPKDFIIAYRIALHLYATPIPNLKPVKLVFFNHLIDMAKNQKKKSELPNISIFDVQLEQSEILKLYSGKESTLRFWLNEFCKKLGLLTRDQYKKGAKVYFSLNRTAALQLINIHDLHDLLHKIKDAYTTRINFLSPTEGSDNPQIEFYSTIPKKKGGRT